MCLKRLYTDADGFISYKNKTSLHPVGEICTWKEVINKIVKKTELFNTRIY